MQKEQYSAVLREHPLALPPVPFGKDIWQRLGEEQRPLLVYGMGNGADKLFERLATVGRVPDAVFASDGFVRGQVFHGYRVISYGEAKIDFPEHTVLLSFGSNKADVVSYLYAFAEEAPLLIPDMPLAGEDYFTASFYEAHIAEIRAVYELLADDSSRDLLASLLWYKLTGEPCFLKRAAVFEDLPALLGWDTLSFAVDVGAYRGDTLAELVANAPNLSRVIAIEPDPKNYKKLLSVAEKYSSISVECIQAASWYEDGDGCFAVSGNRNATLSTGEEKGHLPSYQHKTETVKTVKNDNIINGRRVGYIKFDTEGAELAALKGTEKTIKAYCPCLRVSVYHRSEDLFVLPLYLNELMPDQYELYLRRTSVIPAWECDLVAVPKKEGKFDA